MEHMPSMNLDILDKLPIYRVEQFKERIYKKLKNEGKSRKEAEDNYKMPSMPNVKLPNIKRFR